MPFVRVSRDKRGYETIYLVHTSQRRGRSGATRVLYVFRTPPGVKVGRDPFDAEVRRAIEAQNPGVEFDWPSLSNIPAPPPDVEHWRERRRAEKAARQARKAEELEDPDAGEGGDEGEAQPDARSSNPETEPMLVAAAPDATGVAAGPEAAAAAGSPPEEAPAGRSGKRRRRRRGARKRVAPGVTQAEAGAQAGSIAPAPDAGVAGDDGEDVA